MLYCKIPKISPGAYIFRRPFLRGLSMEGNLRFKIDWASLIVGRKFTVFAILYLRAVFQVQAPWGLIFGRAILRRVFCVMSLGGLYLEGLIFGILRSNIKIVFLSFPFLSVYYYYYYYYYYLQSLACLFNPLPMDHGHWVPKSSLNWQTTLLRIWVVPKRVKFWSSLIIIIVVITNFK